MLPFKIYRLACFEEIAGVLHELTENDGIVVAHIGKIHLALPLEREKSLRPLVGQRISILKTNIPGKAYLFRILSEDVE